LIALKNYVGKKEIIVVDDASTDKSIKEIKKFDDLTLIVRKENGGFPKCCNTGIHSSNGDVIFLLNTDVELNPDFFTYFPEYFQLPDTFGITPQGIHYQTNRRLDGGKVGSWKRGNIRVTRNYYADEFPHLNKPYLSFGVQGAYFFMDKKKLMEMGGGLDEIYTPFIFEETDIGYRAMKRGWKIYYEPRMVAYHDHSTTINSVAKKNKIRAISTRNKLLFVWANIHSRKLLISHFFNLCLRLITFNRAYWVGFYQAILEIPAILTKRHIEISKSTVSDEDLFAMMKHYFTPPGK
jgi:GT2 family glycosyltransferase